nr:LacI family DNA-binding transcriptional regulator [Deinococcus hopiensis]
MAQRAQVSVATVSRVLNGKNTVNSALRSRVEAAMNELRFRPNRVAQTLYHHRSNSIGCILPDIVNPFFAQLFLQLEVGAFERGYTMIMGNTVSTRELERTYLRAMVERQVDGLIYLGGLTNAIHPSEEDLQMLQDLTERLPIVTVNGDLPGVNIVSSVKSEEAAGMRAMLEHLNHQGHTDVAFLGGLQDVTNSIEKLEVYKEFHPDHPTEWVQLTGLDIGAGAEALRRVFQAAQVPTAVVCINDLVAAGALMTAREQGINVPQDLSIAGFDDIFLAQIVAPPLSTVNHNYKELARIALDALLSSINGQPTERSIRVPTLLVNRESIAMRKP